MPPFRAARSLLAERLRSAPCPALNTGRDAHRRLSSGLAIPDPLPTSELDSQLAAARIGVRASDFRTILRAVNLSCSLHQSVVVRRASSGRFITYRPGPNMAQAANCGLVICGGRSVRLGPQARPGGRLGRADMVVSRHSRRLQPSVWPGPFPVQHTSSPSWRTLCARRRRALPWVIWPPAYRPRLLSQAIITKQKSNPWRRFASKATRARNV